MERYKSALGLAGLAVLSVLVIYLALVSGDFFIQPPQPSIFDELIPTAQAKTQSGDLAEAVQAWEDILARDENNGLAHYQLGLILAVLDPDNASPHLEKAADLDPTLAPKVQKVSNALILASFAEDVAYKYIQIGQALGAVGEWVLAKEAFILCVEANPEYAEGWAYLGEARQQTGEDGYPDLSKALELDLQSFAGNILMSLYWRRQGQPSTALPYLEIALLLDPGNLTILEDKGRTLAEMGDFIEARKVFDEIISFSPEAPASWQALARFSIDFEVQVGEIGIPAALKAIELGGRDAATLTLLGRGYMLLDDHANAERYFIDALAIDQNHAPAHLNLGILYLNTNRSKQAKSHLQAVVLLDGDGITGSQAQQILAEYFP